MAEKSGGDSVELATSEAARDIVGAVVDLLQAAEPSEVNLGHNFQIRTAELAGKSALLFMSERHPTPNDNIVRLHSGLNEGLVVRYDLDADPEDAVTLEVSEDEEVDEDDDAESKNPVSLFIGDLAKHYEHKGLNALAILVRQGHHMHIADGVNKASKLIEKLGSDTYRYTREFTNAVIEIESKEELVGDIDAETHADVVRARAYLLQDSRVVVAVIDRENDTAGIAEIDINSEDELGRQEELDDVLRTDVDELELTPATEEQLREVSAQLTKLFA